MNSVDYSVLGGEELLETAAGGGISAAATRRAAISVQPKGYVEFEHEEEFWCM